MLSKLYIVVFEMDEVLRVPELLETVRGLTLRSYSGMINSLNSFIKEMHLRSINAKAIIAYLNGVAVGWVLLSTDSAAHHFNLTRYDDSACVQIFVNPIYRRLGIGSKLLDRAQQIAGKQIIKVYEADAPSFFRINKSTGLNIYNIYND